jgi:hypothetical protein
MRIGRAFGVCCSRTGVVLVPYVEWESGVCLRNTVLFFRCWCLFHKTEDNERSGLKDPHRPGPEEGAGPSRMEPDQPGAARYQPHR